MSQRSSHKAPRMRVIGLCTLCLASMLAGTTLYLLRALQAAYANAGAISEAYSVCQDASDLLQETSDYLTSEARAYVSVGEEEHLYNYLFELQEDDRRNEAIDILRAHATNDQAVEALEQAHKVSDDLAQIELYALRLSADARGITRLPQALADVVLDDDDATLDRRGKAARAHELMFGDLYAAEQLSIRMSVQDCSTLLVGTLQTELTHNQENITSLMYGMCACVIALLLLVVLVIASSQLLLLRPMHLHEMSIRASEPLVSRGARELRTLSDAYNEMYAANHARTESLSHEAHTDALTGLLNRGAFDELLTLNRRDSALILVDVDNFKHFNDDFGHEMGDAVLVEVAATLFASFRSSDHICRIGGDEFAVIATEVNLTSREAIASKIDKVAAFLRDTSNGLPSVTISVGIAFFEEGDSDQALFLRADKALYATKERGRDGLTFAEDLT